ncbi:MAG: hypothetical protein MUC85_13875 [Anaerolineales bacterium]|jgi:hypothetical protein|nr:hypothetical protein [Anaerolineales bacterium]
MKSSQRLGDWVGVAVAIGIGDGRGVSVTTGAAVGVSGAAVDTEQAVSPLERISRTKMRTRFFIRITPS